MALLPGYKVSNSTVWLGRAPAAKLPLAACASLWQVYPLAAWQGYLGTSVGVLFDLFGCQGCLGGGFAKGRDRAVCYGSTQNSAKKNLAPQTMLIRTLGGTAPKFTGSV